MGKMYYPDVVAVEEVKYPFTFQVMVNHHPVAIVRVHADTGMDAFKAALNAVEVKPAENLLPTIELDPVK